MASNVAQLFLLSDHVKLSLLERERASSLGLTANAQDSELARSLESFRTQLEALETQQGGPASSKDIASLRQQYDDLRREFDGSTPGATPATLSAPNDSTLTSDFAHAQSTVPQQRGSPLPAPTATRPNKSVRFHDDPAEEEAAARRAALLPYRDEPGSGYSDDAPDHGALDNQQIHAYHSRTMAEQDAQLDSLGRSVGRQRELSIQIGDELEGQGGMLDEIDEGVDRHARALNRAKGRLGRVARKAKDNASVVIITALVIILVLLIVITK